MKKTSLSILIIIILGFVIYSNSLQGQFVSDDHKHIVDNAAIKDITNIKGIWHSYNTRFIPGLSFAFNHWLGGENTFGYHLFNVIFHVLASILVYGLVRITFQTPYFKDKPLSSFGETIALFAALIFLTHPIQTQGVTYISQRFVSMGTSLYLLVIMFYAKARVENKKSYFILAFISMSLGCLTKEFIATVPCVLCVYEFFFFGSWRQNIKARLRSLVPFFFVLILLPVILSLNTKTSATNLKYVIALSSFDVNYIFTEINVLRTYLRLFILPINLTHSYDYPVAQGFFQISTILSFCLLVSLLALASYLYKKNRWLSFCILWFFITTLVEATAVVFGNRGVIYENWMYLPMVGFAIFVSVLSHTLMKNKTLAPKFLIVVIAIFSVMTYQRNKVWQTEIGLWKDIIQKEPDLPFHHIALANVYNRRGYFEEAEKHLKKSIELHPQHTYVYFNLANLYFQHKKYEESKGMLEQVIELSPDHYNAYIKLGLIYGLSNDLEAAIKMFQKAQGIIPQYAEAYYHLGNIYLRQKNFQEAERNYQMTLHYDPQQYEGYYQLGYVYFLRGHYSAAIMAHQKAIALNAKYADAYNALGVSHIKIGDLKQAEKHFLKALSLDPENRRVIENLSRFYKQIGDMEKYIYFVNQ